jgi:hypothetical protein
LRALCAPLLALGFRCAAAEVVDRLRKDQPALPRAPEDFVALEEAEAVAAEGDAGLPAKRAASRDRRRAGQIRRLLGGGAAGASTRRSTRCWASPSR